MLKFVLRRLVAGVVLIVVLSTVAFFLLYLSGGDIARRILGQDATPGHGGAEGARARAGPAAAVASSATGCRHAIRGDLGTSWFTGAARSPQAITSRLAVTLSLVIGAEVLTAVVAVVLGVLGRPPAAAGWTGWCRCVSVLGFAIPGFLIALGLVTAFRDQAGAGSSRPATSSSPTRPAGWLSSVTLPVIALAIGSIAGVAAQIRGSVIDALRQDYVRTLRSRGLSETRVVYKHVLRNAGRPGPVGAGRAVRRPARRRRDRRADLRDPGPRPGRGHRHRPGRHPAGDGPGGRHRHHRRHRQPHRRPVAGLAQPEGACLS